jgi:hypothetical protein
MNETIPPDNPPQSKTSPHAIWSLTLGIISLVLPCLAIFTAIPGVICGHLGLSRINKSGGTLTGNGLAIGGLITGYIGIVWGIFVFGLMAAIAIPNFVKARETSIRNASINDLRQVQAAKNEWALEKGKSGGDVPTADDLAPYLAGGKFPVFPNGETCTIGAVTNEATCQFMGHTLTPEGEQ